MVSLKKTAHQDYHWVIAAIIFVEMIAYGGIVNSISIYLIPVTEELHISRSIYSLLMMLQSAAATVSTMASAVVFRRMGYRKAILISTALAASSCFTCAVAQNAYMYALGRLLFGISYGVCYTAGAAWIVKAWFHAHHGTVLGAVTMGTGIGGSIFTIFLMAIIQAMSWRWAFVASGILQIGVLLLCLMIRSTPEEMELKPYGEDLNHAKPHAKGRHKNIWPGISVKETQSHPAYWLTAAFIALACVGITMASGVIVPHFQDNGYAPETAARYQSVYMFSLAITKLLCGWVSEKIGGKALTVICMLCATIGLFGLSDLSNPVLAYVAIIVFSIGLTMTTITIPLLSEAVFGHQTSTGVVGILISMSTLASTVSSPISNFCFDAIGSYNPVFRVVAVVELGLIGLLFVIFRMFGKKEKAYWQANPQ